MKNIPEIIYLQIGEEFDVETEFNELAGVTFCTERIFENDIKYKLCVEEEST